jgi:hypothetical protein
MTESLKRSKMFDPLKMAQTAVRGARIAWAALVAVALTTLTASCGGNASGSGSGFGTGTGTGTGSGAGATMTIGLADPATGQARSSLTIASPLNATVTVLSNGQPVANALVQFAVASPGSQSPIAVLSPTSGTGITDGNGRVTVSVLAASATAQGAGTVSATATIGQGSVTAQTAFSVGTANVSLTNVTLTPASIGAFQTSQISVSVTGVPTSVPVTVNFASPCAASGLATLPASAVTANGVASVTYTDKGCSGSDNITISAQGATSVQAALTIQPAPASAIQFVSANPSTIAISGTGAVTSSLVTFKVVNAAQQPIVGVPITLALSTQVGGVQIDSQPGPLTKQTAADGTVSVTVTAGSQPGPVRVTATGAGGLSAVSSQLTIQSGLPTQSRFSLSVQTFNIEGWDVDGTTTSVTIRAADRVGNPVPDGTVVNFRSSGAAIQPSCRTTGGVCSVNFVSQESRPRSPLPAGRVSILAWAVGEESFQDANGNNKYDSGETFGDLGDAFVDSHLDGTFHADSEYIPFNPNATSACAASALSAPSRPDSCDGVWGLAHVRASAQIVLSGSNANANLPSSISLGAACAASLNFDLFDVNGNPMPAGTTVSAQVSPTGVSATVLGSPVVNTVGNIPPSAPLGTRIAIDLSASGCDGTKTALLRVSVRTPLGLTTILPSVTVSY